MSPRVSDLFLRSQSDERLVSLARAGHARAFAAIVERYRPELAALARRLRPDGRDEDLVQQAFLSAFAALRAGSEVKHLRGWLYQIVRNASARDRAAISVPLDGALPAPDTLEDVVAQRALAMDALTELSRLPERQRQAMIGSALNGMGRAEVASSMGLSEGAVRQLIHRARRTLRSAATALTPWPIARWLTTRSAGGAGAISAAGGGAASVGSGGAISSGGVAIKLGVALASGTLATGIAAVAVHPAREHRRGDGPARPARLHAGTGGAPNLALAGASPSILSATAGARIGSTRGGSALEVRFVPARAGGAATSARRAVVTYGGARGLTERQGRSEHGDGGDGEGSGRGDGRGSGPGAGGGGDGQNGGSVGEQRSGGSDQRQGAGSQQPQAGGSDQQQSDGYDQPAGGSGQRTGGSDQQTGGGNAAQSAGAVPTAFASSAGSGGQQARSHGDGSESDGSGSGSDGSGSGD